MEMRLFSLGQNSPQRAQRSQSKAQSFDIFLSAPWAVHPLLGEQESNKSLPNSLARALCYTVRLYRYWGAPSRLKSISSSGRVKSQANETISR